MYKHLLTCELCAFAVNGYTAEPFSINELVAINSKIDEKTHVNSLTASQSIIAFVSIVFIVGFYSFTNSFYKKDSAKKGTSFFIENKAAQEVPNINKTNSENIASEENTLSTLHKSADSRLNITIPETIRPICYNEISANNYYESLSQLTIKKPSNDFYLLNYKIADFKKLYFKEAIVQNGFIGYPSFIENKYSTSELSEKNENQNVTAVSVLEKGLQALNSSNYANAVSNFNTLLNHNKNDINALFYSALAYQFMNDYTHAIANYQKIGATENNSFYEESNWNLALCYLENKNIESATQLLIEIKNANGFYSKKAEEKLKEIKQ
jgi:hypothetical protein